MTTIFLPSNYKDAIIQACDSREAFLSPRGSARREQIFATAAKKIDPQILNANFNFWSPSTWLPALKGWLLKREVKILLTEWKQNSLTTLFQQIKSLNTNGKNKAQILYSLKKDCRFAVFKPAELALFAYSNVSSADLPLKKLKEKARARLKGVREAAGLHKLAKEDFPAFEEAFNQKHFSELSPSEKNLAFNIFDTLEALGDQKDAIIPLLSRREQALIEAYQKLLPYEIPLFRFESKMEEILGFVRNSLFSQNSKAHSNSFHEMIEDVSIGEMSDVVPLLKDLETDFPRYSLNLLIFQYDSRGVLQNTRLIQNKNTADLARGLSLISDRSPAVQRKLQALLLQKGRTSITGFDGLQGAMSLSTPQPLYRPTNEKFITEIHDFGTHIELRYRFFADTNEGYQLDAKKTVGQNSLAFSYELRRQNQDCIITGPIIERPIFSWDSSPKALPKFEENPNIPELVEIAL